jgi:hypothetical protein
MWSRALILGAMTCFAAACGDVAATGVDAAGPLRTVKCGATPVEVLPNGSFDASTPPWVQDPVTPSLLCGTPRITPVDGTTAACLGGTDGLTQTLTQPIALPSGLKTLTLTGEICIATAETATADNDVATFDVLDGTTTIAALGKQTNQQGASACQFGSFTLMATATSDPVTATFRIRSTLNTQMPTSFYIDKLSLTASCN